MIDLLVECWIAVFACRMLGVTVVYYQGCVVGGAGGVCGCKYALVFVLLMGCLFDCASN